MSAQHTPGPWTCDGDASVYALNARGFNRFCAGIQAGWIDDNRRTESSELIANARLIAAAPMLAEALLRSTRTIEALLHVMPRLGMANEIDGAASQLADARAALKEAGIE